MEREKDYFGSDDEVIRSARTQKAYLKDIKSLHWISG